MPNLIGENLYNIGVNDYQIDLFEGQYKLNDGIRYNSYLIKDGKIAVLDTVDIKYTFEWLNNIKEILGEERPTYLIIHHVEPDHSASIISFLKIYPEITIVTSSKALNMLQNFYPNIILNNVLEIKENDILNLGSHELTFISAPMVHWPEVMMSYEKVNKCLFSADAFGAFGVKGENYIEEARRYYFGIVGKFGLPVQNLLKKASRLDIKMICSLHGIILKDNIDYYLSLYNIWSSYKAEEDGICICYTSVYGHTKEAAILLENILKKDNKKVISYDLARSDMSYAMASCFKYSKTVLATTTYNGDIFPIMKDFINLLKDHNFSNRKLVLIENGSWAPNANKIMKEMLDKNLEIVYEMQIKSSLKDEDKKELENIATKLL